MIGNLWGLYWRSLFVVNLIGSVVRFIWVEYASNGSFGVVFKPTMVFGVLGFLLFLSAFYKGGLASYIFGSRLNLEVAVWVKYHLILGSLFFIYAVALYLVYLSGALDYWVTVRAFGSIFLVFCSYLVVGYFVVKVQKI